MGAGELFFVHSLSWGLRPHRFWRMVGGFVPLMLSLLRYLAMYWCITYRISLNRRARSINFRSHDAARTKQGRAQIKGAVYKLKRHSLQLHVLILTKTRDKIRTKSKLKLAYFTTAI